MDGQHAHSLRNKQLDWGEANVLIQASMPNSAYKKDLRIPTSTGNQA
jgi:hypothetical protein